jgi:predicted transposase YdaD
VPYCFDHESGIGFQPVRAKEKKTDSTTGYDRQDAYPTEKQMPYVTSVERIAKAEGREEGREEGVLMGTIRTCQRVLGMAASSEVELQQKSLDELSKMALELQSSIQKRFPSP